MVMKYIFGFLALCSLFAGVSVVDAARIHDAAKEDDLAVVQQEIDKDVNNINQEGPFGRTALIVAAAQGHVDIVDLLLEQGADVNRADHIMRCTALTEAARMGRVGVIERLLQDSNLNVNQADQFGRTALIHATHAGHIEIVGKLLQVSDIDLEHTHGDGVTALTEAVVCNHPGIVGLLLENGADVNRADGSGVTALIEAARLDHKDIVERLLREPDVGVGHVTNEGATALGVARREEIKQLIREYTPRRFKNTKSAASHLGKRASDRSGEVQEETTNKRSKIESDEAAE
jgi:ankyrin repeat protein